MIYTHRIHKNHLMEHPDFLEDPEAVIQQSKELYDNVLVFREPIKSDSRFEDYNNTGLNSFFYNVLNAVYANKVINVLNNIEFQNNFSCYQSQIL